MTVYAVALSKGGSTKTTTAAEIAAALAARGRKVLAIDVDQQGNYSRRLGLTDDTEVDAVAADVLAGTHDLTEIDHLPEVLVSLRDYLPMIAGEWDDVVIDTPPALGMLTLAALAAADVIVAAVACETEAYDQLGRLDDVIAGRVAPRLRPGAQVHWIVPTRYDGRRLLDREVVAELEATHPGRVTTPIREAVAARDAYTAGLPVSLYVPGSGIASDYAAAMAQIITT